MIVYEDMKRKKKLQSKKMETFEKKRIIYYEEKRNPKDKKRKKMTKSVDKGKKRWYIINALEKKGSARESSLKTEQNVNLSS